MQLGALEYLISLNSNNLDKDIKKADGKLTSWAVAKGQMISRVLEKAMSSAGDGLKKVIGGAFSSFADYEQLVGGVDTLFKQSSKKLQQYASMSYKTVGVSANQYMEQVTSFSASLLQSLGGDTDKAADVADMAMQDMADNMNKMGSSMESIQNAYQGFAKQNYTMLDNLKLGYGGTKTEMQRLLKDAKALTGQDYDITKLSDVYQAIHAIQQEMGITGTTSKEAEETITGSMNSAKAAWQDMLVAMGSGKNVQTATRRFADAAQTVIKNATPVISQTLNSLLLSAKTIWPSVKKAINDIWKSTRSTIKGLMPKTIRQLMNIGGTIMKRLTQAYKKDGLKGIWNETKQLFGTLKSSIAEWLKIDSPDVASWGQIGSAILDKIKEKINGETIKKLLLGDSYNSDSTWADVAENISTKLKNAFNSTFVGALNVLGIDAETTDNWKTIATKVVTGIKTGLKGLSQVTKLKIADLLGIEADGDTKWSEIGGEILTRIKSGISSGAEHLRMKVADLIGLEASGDTKWSTIGKTILGRIKVALSTGMNNVKLKISHLLGIEEDGDAKWSTIGQTILERLKNGISSARLKFADLLGVDDPENATWGDIGSKIAEGLGSAFTKGKSFLLKFILGDSYNENESDWMQVGQKISGWIDAGLEEGGFVDRFMQRFSDKWESIFKTGENIVGSISEWLIKPQNAAKVSAAIVGILKSMLSSATAIIKPLGEMLKTVLGSEEFKEGLSSIAGSLTSLLIDVIKSEELWEALGSMFKAILGAIFGDDFAHGVAKLLGIDTGEGGVLGFATMDRMSNSYQTDVHDKATQEKWVKTWSKKLKQAEMTQAEVDTIMGMVLASDPEDMWKRKEISDMFKSLDDANEKAELLKKIIDGIPNEKVVTVTLDYHDNYSGADASSSGGIVAGTGSWPEYTTTSPGGRNGVVVREKKAKGDWNVPHDMIAMLHQGETVLTKSQARRYRDGEDVDYTIIGGMIGSAVERSFKKVNVIMSAEKVGDLTTRRVRRNLNAQSYTKLRALGG